MVRPQCVTSIEPSGREAPYEILEQGTVVCVSTSDIDHCTEEAQYWQTNLVI